MNRHVFYDKKSIAGQAVVELGRAETYLIRCSRAQAGKSVVEICCRPSIYPLSINFPNVVSLIFVVLAKFTVSGAYTNSRTVVLSIKICCHTIILQ